MEKQTMLIAIPVSGEVLSEHFGHAEQFAFVEVDTDSKRVISVRYEAAPPHQPGSLPCWLRDRSVRVVIAGGIGRRALQLLEQNGIKVIYGVQPDTPQKLAGLYLADGLVTQSNPCYH